MGAHHHVAEIVGASEGEGVQRTLSALRRVIEQRLQQSKAARNHNLKTAILELGDRPLRGDLQCLSHAESAGESAPAAKEQVAISEKAAS